MRAKDALGRRGEDHAAAYLQASGLRILDRNWRCPDGEIDIVAFDRDLLVIAEVKTRTSAAYGHPFEAVGAAKLARLHRLGAAWCRSRGMPLPRYRIDVIAVLDDGTGAPEVEHLKAVL